MFIPTSARTAGNSRRSTNRRVSCLLGLGLRLVFVLIVSLIILFSLAITGDLVKTEEPIEYPPGRFQIVEDDEEEQPILPDLEPNPFINYVNYGECRITAYCGCSKCCGKWANNRPLNEQGTPQVIGASGEVLSPNISVASSLPFGTKLRIAGLEQEFVVHDRPAQSILNKYNDMIIDVYFESHEAAIQFASTIDDYREVFIIV
jgi:3D (Asp-Asp-Asp) domain-containing protein